ncbi:unnamed protein product [Gadus morhua 'NCC']
MAQRPAAVSSSAARQPDFIHLNDLASDAAGGKRDPPRFEASAFTEFGKWMDGWETPAQENPPVMTGVWCSSALWVWSTASTSTPPSLQETTPPTCRSREPVLDAPPSLVLEGDRTGTAASDGQLEAVSKLRSETWRVLVRSPG